MKKTISVFVSILLVFINTSVGSAKTQNYKVAQDTSLTFCEDAKELDCIESVSVKTADSKIVDLNFTKFEVTEDRKDAFGNYVRHGFAFFSSSDVGGTPFEVKVNSMLYTPEFNPWGEPGGEWGGLWNKLEVTQGDTTLGIVEKVRTSWLRPLAGAADGERSSIVEKVIPGGRLYTATTYRVLVSEYKEDDQADAKFKAGANADVDRISHMWYIDDIRHGDAPGENFSADCANQGWPILSSDAAWGGYPIWNKSTKTLDYNIGAAHRTAAGEINTGFFKVSVSESYVTCKWKGFPLNSVAGMTVSVIDDNGELQSVVTSVKRSGGRLYIVASGFHYSSPTVRLWNKAQAASATITCAKDGLKSKFVRANKKCPTGWVKVAK